MDLLAAVWRGPLTDAEVDVIHAAYLPKAGKGDHRQRLVHDLYAARYRNASVPLTDAHMARIMAKDVRDSRLRLRVSLLSMTKHAA